MKVPRPAVKRDRFGNKRVPYRPDLSKAPTRCPFCRGSLITASPGPREPKEPVEVHDVECLRRALEERQNFLDASIRNVNTISRIQHLIREKQREGRRRHRR